MIRQFFLLATVSCCAAASPPAPNELRNIGLTSDAGATSVTLSLSAAVAQRLFTLSAPSRVVVDLPRTHRAGSLHVPRPAGVVAAVRTGARPDGTLRVVIELSGPISAHTHWRARETGAGQELVIDLGQETRAASVASAPPQVVRALHAPEDSDRPIVVAVDAGHGGDDPGAIGHGGTREKDVTLAIARALAQRIDAEPGMRAVLTRNRDEFVMLPERMRRAHAANADLFVSVHADSIRDASISGASVYVLSERGATNQAAAWLADRENSADLMAGAFLPGKDPQLESVLIDLSQTATISNSMVAAERVLAALDRVGEVRKPSVQQAGFVVLKSRSIVSMLVETAYISNPQEERRLRTSAQQEKLATAIFSGIRTFFEANPPSGTRFAQLRRAGLARLTPAGPSLP
jgi:N-acetylmuramoyl-L-alanine amidase